jgi:hypothetical protein
MARRGHRLHGLAGALDDRQADDHLKGMSLRGFPGSLR